MITTDRSGPEDHWARTQGCGRVHRHTQASHAGARRRYDRVARGTGFVTYRIDPPQGPSDPSCGPVAGGSG